VDNIVCSHVSVVALRICRHAPHPCWRHSNVTGEHACIPRYLQALTSILRSMQLLRKGANINACSAKRDGGTPLLEAVCFAQNADVINMLIDAGASPFMANRHGTPRTSLAMCAPSCYCV
jgi:hypothetical protein